MSSDVAPAMIISEQAIRPSTARVSSGSSGSSARWAIAWLTPARSGATSSTGLMGLEAGTVDISACCRGSADELLLDPEPLRQDQAGHRGCGLGAEAAALDGHGDHEGAARVGRVGDVPGLVLLAGTLRRAGLAQDPVREALEHVGRRAARSAGRRAQAVEDGPPPVLPQLDLARRVGIDALQRASRRVLDLQAEVRAHD